MKTKFNGFLTLLLALLVQVTFAQEKTVTGTVSDATGPLPGVTVLVKGTKTGTTSDFDGKFSVKVNTGNVLVFSFVGMQTAERTVGASNVINITMQESAESLEEIVVMGYGVKKKRNELTGSTVQVGGAKLEQIPVASVDQSLQGQVAGLQISGNSGSPGAIQNILIRGIGSITAGNEPLFVIDGVPVINANFSETDETQTSTLGTLASLNSNDVESITVLKDASATSAYGARGSNGVIVITTKSGKSGKTVFNASATTSFSNQAIEGRDVMNSEEYRTAILQSFVNRGWYTSIEDAEADGQQEWIDSQYNTSRGLDAKWGEWTKNKDALTKEYNISAQGGDEKQNFYASLGYFDAEGVIKGTEFERISASISYKAELNDKLTFNTKVNGSNSYQDGNLETSAYFESPITAKYFGSPLQPAYVDGVLNTNTNLINPQYVLDNYIDSNNLVRIINNSSLAYKIIDDLTFTSTFSIDYINRRYKQYRPIGDPWGYYSNDGYGYASNFENVNTVLVNSFDYSWRINDEHKVDFKILMENQQNKAWILRAEGESFSTPGLTNLSTAGSPVRAFSDFNDWSNVSYLAQANYGFNNKIFVDLTYRREGSSRFPTENRFGNFWSAGAAWNLHQEAFLENSEAINNLKVRASYGLNGNSAIDINSYQALIGYDRNYNGTGASFLKQFGNADLTWEKNNLLDIGIDFGLFNKFNGSVSYYNRRTFDLLLLVPLSLTTGHAVQNQNVGEMVNKGFEVELNYQIIDNDNVNWSIGGNLATVKNEVTELAKNAIGDPIEDENAYKLLTEGKAYYSWYMRKYAGVDPTNGDALWYVNGKDGETTNVYGNASKEFTGKSGLPTLTAAFNTHVEVKGFFLDLQLYFAGGHQIYETWSEYIHNPAAYYFAYGAAKELTNAWTPENTDTDIPALKYARGENDANISTRFLFDGDYMRVKNIQFGYNIPNNSLGKIGLSSAKIYVRGTNLFTWVKDSGLKYDPEVSSAGYTGLATPISKSISLGVNLKL